MQTIAIIGSGIAGLTAAHLLHPHYDITVFEANDYIGGHTHTIDVPTQHGREQIDTGFIVFNYQTYPNFTKLLDQLNVAVAKSDMSFSVSSGRLGLCYSGETLSSLFFDRRNIVSPRFYRFLWDLIRFNQRAKKYKVASLTLSLGDFAQQVGVGQRFIEGYLVPIAASIWSTAPQNVLHIPASFILSFFQNHGLLNLVKRPQWYVVDGGSQRYVDKIIAPFNNKIFLNKPVKSVRSDNAGVYINTEHSETRFDAVVFACHSDQALQLLSEPTEAEVNVLGSMPYFNNRVTLHTDTDVLPRYRSAWASWNYSEQHRHAPCLTYYMNKLQNLTCQQDYCVSVNHPSIRPDCIIGEYNYAHPVYSPTAVAARDQHHLINNQHRRFYTCAYWGNGFHEDGVAVTLNALAPLGLSL